MPDVKGCRRGCYSALTAALDAKALRRKGRALKESRRAGTTAADGSSCSGLKMRQGRRGAVLKASLSRGCCCAALKAKGVKMRLQDRDAKASWRSGFRHSGRTAVPDATRWASLRCGGRTAVPDESRSASLRYDVRKKAPDGSHCWS